MKEMLCRWESLVRRQQVEIIICKPIQQHRLVEQEMAFDMIPRCEIQEAQQVVLENESRDDTCFEIKMLIVRIRLHVRLDV